jgi:hypothetical protein
VLPGDVRGLAESETLRLRAAGEPFLAGLRERARASAKRRRPGERLVVEDSLAAASRGERS